PFRKTAKVGLSAWRFPVVRLGSGRITARSGRLAGEELGHSTGDAPANTTGNAHQNAKSTPQPWGDRLATEDTAEKPRPEANSHANKDSDHFPLQVAELTGALSAVGQPDATAEQLRRRRLYNRTAGRNSRTSMAIGWIRALATGPRTTPNFRRTSRGSTNDQRPFVCK